MKKFNENWLWLVAAIICFVVAFKNGFDPVPFVIGCSLFLSFGCEETAREKKLKEENT